MTMTKVEIKKEITRLEDVVVRYANPKYPAWNNKFYVQMAQARIEELKKLLDK